MIHFINCAYFIKNIDGSLGSCSSHYLSWNRSVFFKSQLKWMYIILQWFRKNINMTVLCSNTLHTMCVFIVQQGKNLSPVFQNNIFINESDMTRCWMILWIFIHLYVCNISTNMLHSFQATIISLWCHSPLWTVTVHIIEYQFHTLISLHPFRNISWYVHNDVRSFTGWNPSIYKECKLTWPQRS